MSEKLKNRICYSVYENLVDECRGKSFAEHETDFKICSECVISLHDLANTDPLTGVNNRRGLRKVYDYLTSSEANFGIIKLDLINFGSINVFSGEATGDDLLSYTANFLQEDIRNATDPTVSRVGGDEFVVLITDTSRQENSKSSNVKELELKLSDISSRLKNDYESSATIKLCNERLDKLWQERYPGGTPRWPTAPAIGMKVGFTTYFHNIDFGIPLPDLLQRADPKPGNGKINFDELGKGKSPIFRMLQATVEFTTKINSSLMAKD